MANRESFPYIMNIVDEPRKFSPSNVLSYTVILKQTAHQRLFLFEESLSHPRASCTGLADQLTNSTTRLKIILRGTKSQ